MKTDTIIGEVKSVTGSDVLIRLSDELLSNMPIINGVVYRAGQPGSFLKISLGYANLFGIVTKIGATAIPEQIRELMVVSKEIINDNRWLSLILVGEQIGKKFDRGVTQFPTTGDKVHLVTVDDLAVLYGGVDSSSSVRIGNISVAESLAANIDLDKLVTRHCAIVGATGTGKSNAVTVLLKAISEKGFKSARILLIDPHGEYNDSLRDHSRVFKIGADKSKGEVELSIPFWALPFGEFVRLFPGELTDSQRDYLQSEVLQKKLKSIEVNKIEADANVVTADSPIPFSLKQLWFELDDFERQTFATSRDPTSKMPLRTKGDPSIFLSNQYPPAAPGGGSPFLNNFAKSILKFLDGLKIRALDSSYKFLFESGDYSPALDGKVKKGLEGLIAEWLGGDRPITILDLSGIPSELMASVSGALLKIVYDTIFWGQNTKVGGKNQPLMVVLEEAHNYLKAGEDSLSSRTVQKMAKEGRKYGVGLVLVTQRPSELDETVLSQCGTLIALRMMNPKDRSHISAAVQNELQPMVDLLSILKTGEALISGEAVKMMTRVRFLKAPFAKKGSNPEPSVEWLKERPPVAVYKDAVKKWRNHSL